MKRSLAVLVLTIFASALFATAQGTRNLERDKTAITQSERRIALVIGNGAYTKAPMLKNPPNDARDMAATLRALGFEVVSGINVNQKTFKLLIREFGLKLKAGGSGLFYYAGHGVQSKGRNYLIPVDADIQSEAEVEDSGVDVGLVLNFMDDAQNGLNIVILDACRNNPFAKSFRSASGGLAQVDAPTGTLIAYATAPGTVASDGSDQNGLYTSELLKQMRIPGQSATDMFMRVRAEVMNKTAKKHVPWESSSLIGAFYFRSRPKTTPGDNAVTETKFDPAAFELSYWETIRNSTSADDFKAYLEKYPNGQFSSLAKSRVSGLESSSKPVETKSTSGDGSATELAFWDSVKNSNKIEDIQAYIKKYPNGVFAELANNRQTALETTKGEIEAKKNSLAGTVWRGENAKGNEHLQFQFLPNGEFVWQVKRPGDDVNEKGTWTQNGDTITMTGKYEPKVIISGDKLIGTWYKGRYAFTLTKIQ